MAETDNSVTETGKKKKKGLVGKLIKVAIVGGVLFAAAIIILVVVDWNLEPFRPLVQRKLSAALNGRPVAIQKDGLRFGLLKGVIIRGLRVYQKRHRQKIFLNCDEVSCRYDLSGIKPWKPVAEWQIKVKSVRLRRPAIYVSRYYGPGREPVMSYADLLKSKPSAKKDSAKAAPEKQKPPEKKAKADPKKKDTDKKTGKASEKINISKGKIPLQFHAEVVGLEDAKVTFTDYCTDGFDNRYELKKVRFLLSNISSDPSVKMNVDINLSVAATAVDKKGDPVRKKNGKLKQSLRWNYKMPGSFTLWKNGKLDPTGHFTPEMYDGYLTGWQVYDKVLKTWNETVDKVEKTINDTEKKAQKIDKTLSEVEEKLKVLKKNKMLAQKAGIKPDKLLKTVEKYRKEVDRTLPKVKKACEDARGALKLPFLDKAVSFKSVKSKLKVRDQKLHFTDIGLKSKDYKGEGEGTVSFTGYVDFAAVLRAPGSVIKSEYGDVLKNKNGKIEMRIFVKGPASSPEVELKHKDIAPEIKKLLLKKTGMEKLYKQWEDIRKQHNINEITSMEDVGGTAKKLADDKINEAKDKAEARKKKLEREAKKRAKKERKKAEKKARKKARKKAQEETDKLRGNLGI